MKYEITFTNRFKKELKFAKKQGKDIDKLFEIVEILAEGKELAPRYRDHILRGDFEGFRECHIEADWLLIYKIYEDILVLSLVRLGSHSKLF